MSSRPLTTAIAIAAVLGLAAHAFPKDQEKAGTAKARVKGKAAAGAKKAGAEKTAESEGKIEKATFGGGCFWCLEAVFERIPGVKSVVSGYAGGTVPRPTYAMVSSGLTGHAEVVQITYDPAVVTFETLLEAFWECHDPTTLNRQGPDFGTQYRSIILYHNDAQKQAAQESYRALTDAGVFADPIVTQLVPLKAFYVADHHHQDYYRKNRNAAYCRMYITPKVMKMQAKKAKSPPATTATP